MSLNGKLVLITGGARRIGRSLALAIAGAGGDVVIHYQHSQSEAETTRAEIEVLGRKAFLLQADLSDPVQAAGLIPRALGYGRLFALVNNAAIFEPLTWESTGLEGWNRHLMVNLTAPFLLCQAFARTIPPKETGRIVNLLDWRSLRPGPDHLPYTVSKSALAALTRSLAVALAPQVNVNGLALGAILSPSDGAATKNILDQIPAGRWASLEEVDQALIFLLDGPAYVMGDILYVDGGRHLV
jgi:NAD(P)-dependent dehydrogenase (short-subunit alcohol dehydrogenase family)